MRCTPENQAQPDQRDVSTPSPLPYRMPAEWHRQDAVWVSPPHNAETWPDCLDRAREQFDHWMDRLSRRVTVRRTDEAGIPTLDSWIRDYGPVFVIAGPPTDDDAPSLLAHDFRFTGYGYKYDPPETDDNAATRIASLLDVPRVRHEFVLEGGSIDVNGCGTLLTTEQCLLNANRNPQLNRTQIERTLHETLGASHVIWLPGGIEGDDTDGHVDDVARFIAPDTVAIVQAPPDHPDHEVLARNLRVLRDARDERGQRLNIIELPAPDPQWFEYPGDRFTPPRRQILPCSYANFLISNGAVFVPTFGVPQDEPALHTLAEAMPGIAIEPVRSEWLVVGQGGPHCLSLHQPSPPAA